MLDFLSCHCFHCRTVLKLFFALLGVLTQLARLTGLNCLSFSVSSLLTSPAHGSISAINLCTIYPSNRPQSAYLY